MSETEFEWPRDMIPMDELELRYSIMEDIRDRQRLARGEADWNFSRLKLSVLRLLPLVDLQRLGHLGGSVVFPFFDDMNRLVHHFLQKNKVVPDNQTNASAAPHSSPASNIPAPSPVASSNVPSKRPHEDSALAESMSAADDIAQQKPDKSKPKSRKIHRNQTEREKCLVRGGSECIVTKTMYPQVCHIIPFTWNNTESNRQTTKSLMSLVAMCFGLEPTGTVDSALSKLHKGLCTSDRGFKMVAMAPTLHAWWGKGCFALKWLGVTPSDLPTLTNIKLQLIWMPWSPIRNATQVALLEDEKDEKKCLLSGLEHSYAEVNELQSIMNTDTGRPIQSGTVIVVTRPSDMVEDFKVMIDLQYALIRAAAISGATQSPELLVPGDENSSRVIDWQQQIGQGPKSHGFY